VPSALSCFLNHQSAQINTNENATPFAQVAALPEQLAAFGSQLATSYALRVAAPSQLPVSVFDLSGFRFQVSGLRSQVSGLSLQSSALSCFFSIFFCNHESARMNTNKMPLKAEREGSGAPECQQREIKIACKRACRGFYFSGPIRKANTSLSAIRAHLGNLTRYAQPFRAAFGTLSRFARLWLGSPQPLSVRGSLKNYPEVSLEISESGHGLMLSFLKVAPQPESQPEFTLEQRVMALLQSQALGKKQISEVNQKY
jgi:hypothetical protein